MGGKEWERLGGVERKKRQRGEGRKGGREREDEEWRDGGGEGGKAAYTSSLRPHTLVA